MNKKALDISTIKNPAAMAILIDKAAKRLPDAGDINNRTRYGLARLMRAEEAVAKARDELRKDAEYEWSEILKNWSKAEIRKAISR